MSISFHCEHCGKRIEAPDNAGGRWGKCPGCHKKVYVPSEKTDEGELKLAPTDEEEERRRNALLAETVSIREDILSETDVPEEQGETAEPPVTAETTLSDSDLTESIITYLRLMADGELDQAEKSASFIVPYGSRAIKIFDRIALGEILEPKLADIPLQVLSGLIRNLRNRINQT